MIFISMWFVCVSECGVQKHFACFWEYEYAYILYLYIIYIIVQ